ncbi:MAG: DUF937 domain-containing protein [Gammaproteobacteria bacterium]|nr:DUF937 domain-containing protein [Gammaproteobacteria bacterium]
MNLLEMLLDGGNKGTISELGRSVGLDDNATRSVLERLAPALSRGIQKNASTPKGMEDLMAALEKGNHQRYVDDLGTIGRPETTDDGNGILGHIFGSKDVSRNVAGYASKETGVSSSIIKKLLPVVASIAMGALSKQTQAGRSLTGTSTGGGLPGILSSFLDADKDGSVADDLINLARKFF